MYSAQTNPIWLVKNTNNPYKWPATPTPVVGLKNPWKFNLPLLPADSADQVLCSRTCLDVVSSLTWSDNHSKNIQTYSIRIAKCANAYGQPSKPLSRPSLELQDSQTSLRCTSTLGTCWKADLSNLFTSLENANYRDSIECQGQLLQDCKTCKNNYRTCLGLPAGPALPSGMQWLFFGHHVSKPFSSTAWIGGQFASTTASPIVRRKVRCSCSKHIYHIWWSHAGSHPIAGRLPSQRLFHLPPTCSMLVALSRQKSISAIVPMNFKGKLTLLLQTSNIHARKKLAFFCSETVLLHPHLSHQEMTNWTHALLRAPRDGTSLSGWVACCHI